MNNWELIKRHPSGGAMRLSPFTEWATVFQKGIRFSKPAKDKYFGESKFLEIYMDKDTNGLAFKPLSEPTHNCFSLSMEGDIKGGKPNWYVACRSAVGLWNKDLKGRHHCELKPMDGGLGLIELIPLDYIPDASKRLDRGEERHGSQEKQQGN